MNELEKLKPEVREAVQRLDDLLCRSSPQWVMVRAELLRLARDNEALRSKCNVIMSGSTQHLGRAERAESELAALKRRIAESPVGEIVPGRANSFSGFHVEIAADCLWHTSKRFRLLLDDGESA